MLKRLGVIPFIIGFAILAASCLVRSATIAIVGTNYVYTGEAANLTQVDVEQSYVKLDYLDGGGNVIATQFVSPCTRTLQAGAISPVEGMIPQTGVTVASVKATVQWVTIAHRDLPALGFSSPAVSESGTTLFVSGNVANSSASAVYAGVHVCMAAYDASGNVVSVGDGFPATSSLGASANSNFSFSAQFTGTPVSVKLWVDAWDVGAGHVTGAVMTTVSTITAATATPTVTPVPPTNTPVPPTNTPAPTNTPGV